MIAWHNSDGGVDLKLGLMFYDSSTHYAHYYMADTLLATKAIVSLSQGLV